MMLKVDLKGVEIIKRLINWINSNVALLLLIGMIGCIGGIVISYLFENESITALGFNMDESTAYAVMLDEKTDLEYNSVFNEKLLGIQVKLTNYGKPTTSGTIHYEVSSLDDGRVLGSSSINGAGFVDGNYIFMSFTGFEECIGGLKMKIWIEGVTDGHYPGFYVNTQKIPDVSTIVNGEVQEGNLVLIYNTPLYNKPLLFDFTMLLGVFFSVFAIANKESITNRIILKKLRKRDTV